MFFAQVDGEKRQAQPGLMGVCSCCLSPVISKCGAQVAWHWAHTAGRDCDSWAEPIGPWHISWQEMVLPQYVEVSQGPHRADIGNGGSVVELQHSPISEEEIRDREQFYGNMVWLFDATFRFRMVESGDRAFFAFGRTKHIQRCQKPVFLDFGETIVEVEQFTEVLSKCSGFGMKRDRSWFMSQYLSETLRSNARVNVQRSSDLCPSNPWETDCPYRTMKHPTKWLVPSTSDERIFPTGTKYLPLNYDWAVSGKGRRPVWGDVIDRYPMLANGWSKTDLQAMKQFLNGMAVIFDGRLRLIPATADQLRIASTVTSTCYLLQQLEPHIQAGRIPVLKEETKRKLLEQAERFEIAQYGNPLSQRRSPKKRGEEGPGLFG